MTVARRFIAGKTGSNGPVVPSGTTDRLDLVVIPSAVPTGLNNLFICPETGDKSPAYYHVFLRNTDEDDS